VELGAPSIDAIGRRVIELLKSSSLARGVLSA
jgi:hypothetical protein